jgi:group I intron endonuclease
MIESIDEGGRNIDELLSLNILVKKFMRGEVSESKVPNVFGIYKITSPDNKIYIGKSNKIGRRFKEYKFGNVKYQTKLKNSFLEYGIRNHEFEIIELCSEEIADDRERFYIKMFDTFRTEHGLNLTSGGGKGNRNFFTEEHKKKISEAQKGRVLSEKSREAMSLSRIGKVRTEESKRKASATLKANPPFLGRHHTLENKQIMSDAKKGANNFNYGKKLSEEYKRKISISRKAAWDRIKQERLESKNE